MKNFFKGNMKERYRWYLVMIVGISILTANKEMEFVPRIWEYFKTMFLSAVYFFV